ncbi:cobalt transport protein [Aciduliprofundum boonei T469]|uniref:Cobalt transport protein n=2 Tax=Candidatus Aciduliprofundum boonei TaxID=379547 RepID=B5ICH4_ACIB4|nr:cobalt transport protein [Aciduliprofundum boonei T469]EDY35950.1 Cobalt transport protein [Aciduliprofundum boonei T469]
MIILLLFLLSLILSFLAGRVQIMKININHFVIFVWLMLIIYLSLIFSSPYILFSIFLSLIVLKMIMNSHLWHTLMRYTIYFSIFIFIFNILLGTNGETVLVEWNFIKITYESIVFSSSMILRLLIIMGAFAIFNSNVGMEDLINILERLKIPHKAIMTLSISLRFFPIMLEEARDSLNALKLKGLPVSTGSLKDRINARYPAMATLLNISMERAIEIGEALETKGYPSKSRRAWKRINLNTLQKMAVFILIFTAIMGTIYITFHGNFVFYPKVGRNYSVPMCILMFSLPLSLLLGRVSIYD